MLNGFSRRIFRSAACRLKWYGRCANRRLLDLEFAHLGLARTDTIQTWTLPNELEALYRLAAECPPDANIVEIGSYLGAATCHLAAGAAAKGARIVCIDTWHNETMPDGERDTLAEFQRNTSGVARMITMIRKPSAEVKPSELPQPIHLAFIDADHAYEATKSDAALLLPLMAPDGAVAFHDTAAFDGVSRALAEILLTREWSLAGHVDNLTWIRRAEWSPWPPNGSATAPR